tara:strand:- start:710 stop:1069 length:360 start_codon:yes stop_codon:yes gene_type:complete
MADQEEVQALLKRFKLIVNGTNITDLHGHFYGANDQGDIHDWEYVTKRGEKLIGQIKSEDVVELFDEASEVLLLSGWELCDGISGTITYNADYPSNSNGSLILSASELEWSKPHTQHFS